MTLQETLYANTDFDLQSRSPFRQLHKELNTSCCGLIYGQRDNGHWHATYESNHDGTSAETGADRDIAMMLNAVASLSPEAKLEFDSCHLREFNIGFECWDTWSYVHRVSQPIIRAVADAECTIAVTLYPMRHPDGTLRS